MFLSLYLSKQEKKLEQKCCSGTDLVPMEREENRKKNAREREKKKIKEENRKKKRVILTLLSSGSVANPSP